MSLEWLNSSLDKKQSVEKSYASESDVKKVERDRKKSIGLQEKLEFIERQIYNSTKELWFSEEELTELVIKIQKLPSEKQNSIISYINSWEAFIKKDIYNRLVKLNIKEDTESKEESVESKEESVESKEESVESKEESVESKEESVENIKEDTESKEEAFLNLRSLSESLVRVPNNPDYQILIDFTKKYVKDWEEAFDYEAFKKDFEKLSSKLQKNPEILASVSAELKIGSEEYNKLKNSLLNLSKNPEIKSNLKSQFDLIESVWHFQAKEFARLWIEKNKWLKKVWDSFVIDNWDLVINLSSNSRTINLSWSNYKLSSPLNNKLELQKIEENNKKLIDILTPINKELYLLNSIENFLQNNLNADFSEIKNFLKQNFPDFYTENNIENLNSIWEIKNKIQEKKKELNKKKKEEIEKSRKFLSEIILANAEKAEEKDEKQKEILEFFAEISFDLIPKKITDKVIEYINITPWLKAKYGLDSKIDIANWNLWINRDLDSTSIGFEEKRLFTQLVNMMISGNKNIPNSFTEYWLQFFETPEDKQANKVATNIDKQAYINSRIWLNKIWSDPYTTIINNLEKASESTPKKEK